jgi:hypothetical protein
MKTLFNFNKQALKLTLASTLMLGAATMSGSSVAAPVNGTASGTVAVGATLVAACEVTAATIAFGSFANLLTAGDKTASSGTSFQVACSNDVAPLIYTTAPHVMLGGIGGLEQLPFNLSLTSGAASDTINSTPTAFSPVQDGVLHSVPLYAKVLAANFTGANARTSGTYTVNLTVSVDY